MQKYALITLLGLIASLGVPGAAAAPAERPCQDDVMNHCGESIGNRDEMRQCMRDKFNQFSEQCQTALLERRQERQSQQGGGRPEPAESGN